MIRAALIGAALAWLGAVGTASAQSLPQSSFQATATITEGCLVGGGEQNGNAGELGKLDFGSASALSEAVKVTAVVQTSGVALDCTPGITLTMQIDGGQHPSLGTRQIALDGSEETLAYTLFTDAGLQQEIGIDSPVSVNVDQASTAVTLPIYGRLALPGNVSAGHYTDRLRVTLAW